MSQFETALFAITLDRGAATALHQQLSAALRALILSGAHGGARLPSSRALAAELSVSRITVTAAYDQLSAEGYLTPRRGAGSFVAADLPHISTPPPRPTPQPRPDPRPWPVLTLGLPDQRLFPHRLWARHLQRAWQSPDPALLHQGDLFGWGPLRQAISDHLQAWRGLSCDPAQVVVTAGAGDAFDLLAALLPPAAAVVVEDPGWPALHDALRRGGLTPCPRRIDAQGLPPDGLPAQAGAAIVTPSRHYPTGRALPLERRLALLHWAEASGALILEDDYDSEFRYQGQPLPALAGLDQLRRTLYLGSFSKLLSPALRIGYLVLPEQLIGPARTHLRQSGPRASLLPQPALATFMASGGFATHLRRMRRAYAARQKALLQALAPAQDVLDCAPDPSGMHLCLPLRGAGPSDAQIAGAAQDQGLGVRALSSFACLPDAPQALLLGYAAFDTEQLEAAGAQLCQILEAG